MLNFDEMTAEELVSKASTIANGIAKTADILIRDTPIIGHEETREYVEVKDFLLQQAEFIDMLLEQALLKM